MISLFELSSAVELGIIYGIAAIGIYITFRVIDFPDLTVDGSFVTGAAICASMLKHGFDPITTLIMGGIFGGIAGFITSVIHIYCKISNLLSSIITAFMLYSINLHIMSDLPNISLINELTIFSSGPNIWKLGVISLILIMVISYILITNWGLALRSIGINSRMAATYGINVNKKIIAALIISNGLIGFAGALFCQNQGFADISMGAGTLIICLAAVIIGEKLLPSKNAIIYAPLFCIIGSIIYRLIITFALRSEVIGLKSYDLNLITGILVILIMAGPKLLALRSK